MVWQEKTLSFQTLPSLISDVRRLPAGCQRWCRSRGCVCRLCLLDGPVVFGCGVLNHGSSFVFEETSAKKNILQFFFFTLPLLSLPPTTHACTRTHTSPKPLPPYPPPSDPSDFLPVGAVRDSSSLRSGNETSKQ